MHSVFSVGRIEAIHKRTRLDELTSSLIVALLMQNHHKTQFTLSISEILEKFRKVRARRRDMDRIQ
ncbi:hypothetical protein, partial [Pseudomonas syringae]